MFDARLQPWLRRIFEPPARALVARGIGADTVTLVGFAIGVGAGAAIAASAFNLGLALVLFNRVADGLDGAMARASAPTARGAFLDIALDFVFYGLVPLGFAFADPLRNALPAATLLAAFIGTESSFLAFAAVAAERGLKAPEFPSKGLYYLGGLAEGGETIAFLVAICLWPVAFPPLALLFAGLCLVTTLTRWRCGWRAFTPNDI